MAASFFQRGDHRRKLLLPLLGPFGGIEHLAIVTTSIRRDRRRGVDYHLVRHSIRLTGRIQQVLREVRQDHHVASRVGANGHGPHDLIEIERIDVGIDHDDEPDHAVS